MAWPLVYFRCATGPCCVAGTRSGPPGSGATPREDDEAATVRGRLAEASQEKEGKGETARRSLQGRLAKAPENKRKTGKSCGTDSAYTGRVATISSSWRPFPLGRVLLTLAEWLPFIRHGDLWRPFPKRLSHHVMEDGYLLSPFRNYIILYCKRGRGDEGGSSPIVPGPRSQTGHSFSFEKQAVARCANLSRKGLDFNAGIAPWRPFLHQGREGGARVASQPRQPVFRPRL